MKFCKNCGKQLNERVKFCGNCGTKISILQSIAVQKKTIAVILILIVILVSILAVVVVLKPESLNKKEKTTLVTLFPENPEKVRAIKNIIAAANIKDYPSEKKGVVFVEEGANLNLRPCPQVSDDCAPIEKLEQGTEIAILGETDDWYKIRHNKIIAFTGSRFVINKENWDKDIRRSHIGILSNIEYCEIADSDDDDDIVEFSIILEDAETGKKKSFIGYGNDCPYHLYMSRVKVLINKNGHVEKIELVR